MPAFIPYGAYWSSPFARWQGALSHLHAIEFAAHTARAELAERQIDLSRIDSAIYGMTVPQRRSFYGAPWFTGLMGAAHLPGVTLSQACATGTRLVANAAAEIGAGTQQIILVASGDRTSNSPHVYYPAPSGPGGMGASEDIVMESFNLDPFAGCSMIQTAENLAKKYSITTAEQHDLVLRRAEQYQAALADSRAFQRRYMTEKFEVPSANFKKTQTVLEGDAGVYPTSPEKLAKLQPVLDGGSVTFASQTHPADGNAGILVVNSTEAAQEFSQTGAPIVEICSWGQARVAAGMMPLAPVPAARAALQNAGLKADQIQVIKTHNPFAVNDIVLARELGRDWQSINHYGSSLIWGHPQGPTALRSIIEMIEELALQGGGYGLFTGCAAGDSAMALIVKVTD